MVGLFRLLPKEYFLFQFFPSIGENQLEKFWIKELVYVSRVDGSEELEQIPLGNHDIMIVEKLSERCYTNGAFKVISFDVLKNGKGLKFTYFSQDFFAYFTLEIKKQVVPFYRIQ